MRAFAERIETGHATHANRDDAQKELPCTQS
jgi:hypothetical protein